MDTLQTLFEEKMSKEEYYTLLYSIRPALVITGKLHGHKVVSDIVGMTPSVYSLWLTHTNIKDPHTDQELSDTIVNEALRYVL